MAVAWLSADWGACVAWNGVAVGRAAVAGAAAGGGVVSVNSAIGVAATVSVGAAAATNGVSVAETPEVGASTPGIGSWQALKISRIRIDTSNGIRFMSILPNIWIVAVSSWRR